MQDFIQTAPAIHLVPPMNVLILAKTLDRPPLVIPMRSFGMGRLAGPQDVYAWLALRERAFADETPRPRPWTRDDFQREFDARGDRSPRVTWLAHAANEPRARPRGAVSVCLPKSIAAGASLHWLLVDPDCRRMGLGSFLLKIAERHCWELGYRELRLETHRGWAAAVEFYRRHGYRQWESLSPSDPPS